MSSQLQTFKLSSGSFRDFVAKSSILALLLPFLLFFVGGQIATAPSASAAYSACAAPTTGVPNPTIFASNYELTPSHGKNFYVDFSKTPYLNASYIGYRVKNVSGVAKNNVWVKLSGFSSGTAANNLLSLANAADYKMQIPSIGINEVKTVYFLIAASRASARGDATTTQKHTVEIFNGDPDAQGASTTFGCDYTFNKVEDVIEAAANKVTSVTASNTTPSLGELVTVIAQGTPGTVGSGDTSATGDRDIVWLSPSAFKTFPTRALRLESVKINFGTVNSGAGCQVEYEEQLLMTGMSACVQNVTYTATYKFRVIGSSAGTVTLAPIANIASGTQVKHTDGSSATATINLANVATTSKFEVAKTTSLPDSITVGSQISILYSVKVTNTGTTDLTLDYVVDDPSNGSVTYVANSGAFVVTNKTSAGSSTAINPSTRSDGNFYFVGPFTIPGSTSISSKDSFVTISYRMLIPQAPGTYTNSATGYVGSQRVSGASSVAITTDGTGATGVSAPPTATTTDATSVLSTSATLNGSLTTGGDSAVSVKFAYSTSSTDVTNAIYTSTSSGSLVIVALPGSTGTNSDTSTALSGLTTGTTYFFKIMVANSTNTFAYGDVLSFQTGAPTATTTAATSVTTTSATINGTVGTGGDSGAKYYFIYGTDPDLSGATSSTETVIPGSSVTFNWTGLTASTTYYFRVVAKNSTGTITVNGEILNFTTSAATPAPAPVIIPPVTITWPTQTPIQYPTPLSNTQQNATALCQGVAVTGTYTYFPALGTILAPGTYTMTVTFTPTSGGCQGASTTVQLVVRAPNAPTITWPTPAPVTGPHTLSPTQLNATCSVPGTLTYDPALGTVLQPGTYTLRVTCTPTDPNYPPVSTTVPLVVEKQNPKITWVDPNPIIIGTPLSPTQLNALFSVPGTCVYTPALGTLLPVGIHTLSVTCTPTNGNLYNPMTTTVKIEVLSIERSTVTPIVIPGGGPSTQPVPREAQGSQSRVITLGPCLTSATLVGARMTFTPGDGCSGRTYVTITTIINGRTTIVTIPVTIQVVPAPSKTGPVTFTEGKIWWTKSPNANSYEVTIWGQSVCSTTTTSCDVVRTIGPKTPVLVIAKGNDGLTATSRAVYENKKPLVALNVYFDTAKFVIKPEGRAEINRVAAIIKKEGFTRLIIEGHTDTQGGIDNQTLSNNRSRVTSAALRKLLPPVSVRLSGSAFRKPAASNDTPEGMALNRRTEVLVW